MFTIPNVRDLITTGATLVRVPRTPDQEFVLSPGEHIGHVIVRRIEAIWQPVDGRMTPVWVIGQHMPITAAPLLDHYSDLAKTALSMWVGAREDIIRLTHIIMRKDCWLLLYVQVID